MFLKLRSKRVRQSEGVVQLFGLVANDITDPSEQESIVDFVRKHPSRVCVILDGLDETCLSDCSDYVRDVINGDEMLGIRLLGDFSPYTGISQAGSYVSTVVLKCSASVKRGRESISAACFAVVTMLQK